MAGDRPISVEALTDLQPFHRGFDHLGKTPGRHMAPARFTGGEEVPVAQVRGVTEGGVGDVVGGQRQAVDFQQCLAGLQFAEGLGDDAGTREVALVGLQTLDLGHDGFPWKGSGSTQTLCQLHAERVRITMGSKITPAPRAKPLKRPTQARARFTVQAIFDTYVRIWQRDGWAGLTTRAVALEAGVAVGTLYDYFPSKEALHSAYVRHCMETLISAVDEQAVQASGLDWQQRVARAVSLLCGLQELSWFHPDMLALEPQVAEQKHQQRAWTEFLALWRRLFDACNDLPVKPDDHLIEALHLAVWGGRRYAMQLRLDAAQLRQWAAEMETMCLARLGGLGHCSD